MEKRVFRLQRWRPTVTRIPLISGRPCVPDKRSMCFTEKITKVPIMAGGSTFPRLRTVGGTPVFLLKNTNGANRITMVTTPATITIQNALSMDDPPLIGNDQKSHGGQKCRGHKLSRSNDDQIENTRSHADHSRQMILRIDPLFRNDYCK